MPPEFQTGSYCQLVAAIGLGGGVAGLEKQRRRLSAGPWGTRLDRVTRPLDILRGPRRPHLCRQTPNPCGIRPVRRMISTCRVCLRDGSPSSSRTWRARPGYCASWATLMPARSPSTGGSCARRLLCMRGWRWIRRGTRSSSRSPPHPTQPLLRSMRKRRLPRGRFVSGSESTRASRRGSPGDMSDSTSTWPPGSAQPGTGARRSSHRRRGTTSTTVPRSSTSASTG